MPSSVISTSGLTRRFNGVPAVDNLELSVPKGSIYGFLGPNGAGKTTTIRLLLGLIKADAGEVLLFEKPFSKHRISLLGRVGALVEVPSLYPHLTGRENLEVTRRSLGIAPSKVDRALDLVRMKSAADKLVRRYSLGMRQRLGLALALMTEPELLILDEPTNGLDPAGIREIRDLIRDLPGKNGITVFLSSHLLSEVEQVATHIGILQKGRLLFQSTKSEMVARLAKRLLIGVEEIEQAGKILEEEGLRIQGEAERMISVQVQHDTEASRINSILVKNGLHVFKLSLERPSLEENFLNLTGEHRI